MSKMTPGYKLLPNSMILRKYDNFQIPMVEENIDYQEYLRWVAFGNQPEPVATPEEIAEQELKNEISELKNNLQNQHIWLFRMLMEMWKAARQAGVVSNQDIDPDVLAKAQQWVAKLDRLKEIDE